MNNDIINILNQQLNEYSLDKSKRWKASALHKALKILKDYPHKINSGKELLNIKGIGKGIISRIDEIIQTGTLKDLKNVSENLKTVKKFKEITGVGYKRANEWVKEGFNTVKQIKEAIKANKIKTTHHIDIGLKYFEDFQKRIPRKEITKMSKIIKNTLENINKELIFEICGSYRRGCTDSGDIDILITNPNISSNIEKEKYLTKLVKLLKKENFIIDDLTKTGQKKYMGVCKLNSELPARRIDIRCFNSNEYYAAILYFTGSKDFNVLIRQNAIDSNYSLNEYGLKDKNSGKIIKLKSEKELFDILNIPYMDPTERDI